MLDPDLDPEPAPRGLRRRLYNVVVLSDTPAGRVFDVGLIVAIVASVVVVMLDSVASLHARYAAAFLAAEWFFTVLFTVEYLIRLAAVRRQLLYATSFYGIIDLLAVLPTYVSLIVPGTQVLLVVRILRTLRIFRILKLSEYLSEADYLREALVASRRKIFVFLFTVLVVVTVAGAMMYLVEGGRNGFDSIPRSIYWAVVTLTTVGYGDISPVTPLGQALALCIMVMGYGIIAVPTGIVTVELNRGFARSMAARPGAAPCPQCGLAAHDGDAQFCKHCGGPISASPAGATEREGAPTPAGG